MHPNVHQPPGSGRLLIPPLCKVSPHQSAAQTTRVFIRISRLQRWTREKSMSFVPPDGHFVLSEYRYTPSPNANSALRFGNSSSSGPGAAAGAPPKEAVPIPFAIKARFEIEDTTGTKGTDVLFTGHLNEPSLLTSRIARSLVQPYVFITPHHTAHRTSAHRAEFG